MHWIEQLQVGDCWYNKDRDHIAILYKKTKNYIYYEWMYIGEIGSNFTDTRLKVKIEQAINHAKTWTKLTSLEKELI